MSKRTKTMVLKARQTHYGCCDRNVDQRTCDCLELAEDDPLEVGDEVGKRAGYKFPGIVRAVFANGDGETRYVVEHLESGGLLHIFSGAQLELVARPDCTLCGGEGWIRGKDSNDVDRCYKCERIVK